MKFNNELYERTLERYALTKEGRLLMPDGKEKKAHEDKDGYLQFSVKFVNIRICVS